MKKMMLALGLIVTMGITSAFAGEEKISAKVLEAFKSEFSTATDVSWVTGSNYYRAAFTNYDSKIFAYYSMDGELLSVSRYISSLQLPLNLLTKLKNDYNNYWISDLFEVSNREGTHYYVTVENADTAIMLKSANGSDWEKYKKKTKV